MGDFTNIATFVTSGITGVVINVVVYFTNIATDVTSGVAGICVSVGVLFVEFSANGTSCIFSKVVAGSVNGFGSS